MRLTTVRMALAGLATGVFVLLGTAVAHADTSATLSALSKAANGSLTGLLTVRAGQDTAAIDRASLVVNIGGNDYPVTAQPAGSTVERSTILLIDRSGSMGTGGMNTVRTSVLQFLQVVPPDVKVGVVSFADKATRDVEPNLDRGAVQAAVNGLKADGDTRLYDAVDLAIQSLGQTGDRSILLLSDGKDTISTLKGTQAEERLKASGIQMQVIAFRTTDTDNLALQYLAAAGGQGTVVQVGDSAGVAGAFTNAARALDSQVSWTVKPNATLYGRQDVVLRGTANGDPFSTTATVDFGAAPAPTSSPPTSAVPLPSGVSASGAAPEALPGPAQGSSALGGIFDRTLFGLPFLLALAVLALFLGILLLVMALLSSAFKSRRQERVESIENYITPPRPGAMESARKTSVSGIADQLVQMGDRAVKGRESTPKTVLLLQRADLPWRAGEWAVLRVLAIVIATLLGILVFRANFLVTVLGAILGILIGLVIPPQLLKFLAARRARKFERQLPDVLNLVASSLSTGFSLPQALDAVAHDVPEPTAKEFSRAMAETRIGSDLTEALTRMAERMDSKNMTWATMAIDIQRRVGGNLAETLRTTASTLREREALFRQVRALSAEGRLSALILVALPILIFCWMLLVNNDYISLLWRSLLGLMMLFATVVLMAIGILWIRKVVEVKV